MSARGQRYSRSLSDPAESPRHRAEHRGHKRYENSKHPCPGGRDGRFDLADFLVDVIELLVELPLDVIELLVNALEPAVNAMTFISVTSERR